MFKHLLADGKKHLIVLGGATATGKTAVAVRLAQALGTEVLSADSRQFYREMTIGTAKPSQVELGGVPHHFLDFRSIAEPYSVGDFERDALQVLEQIFQKKNVAILVGGSGLYLRAVYAGLDEFPSVSPETKARVRAGEETGGLAWLQAQVAERDPAYFARVDRQNPARLRRALEVCYESGRPYSDFLTQDKPGRNFETHLILLELPRPELYARINARVDRMVATGLEAEARALLPYRHLPALHTVGYEEWFDFFDGTCTREETIEKIKQHSRNYAKRQATWFRKHGYWAVFHPEQLAG
ncbi:MAG: tRNA (adenosine(37)-N6)-dimethylallyltransferase MiaA [Saprospiraceae bacterium]|jgi:tRNA dimethylallyltransferase|nr:tRNA (adenosine(37)-N6)-dimethylallyltransferase MiaA [Saprospiraceae bacterium]